MARQRIIKWPRTREEVEKAERLCTTAEDALRDLVMKGCRAFIRDHDDGYIDRTEMDVLESALSIISKQTNLQRLVLREIKGDE